MADNFTFLDSAGATKTCRAKDTTGAGGPLAPYHAVNDGDDLAIGATSDTQATSDAGTFSLIALFKRLLSKLTSGITVSLSAAASGGATPYHLVSAASTNATVVKASAGTLKGIHAFNINASPRYLKFYDTASTPTAGSGTVKRTVLIPGNTSGGGASLKLPPEGINFASGIAFVTVTGIADTDATAVAANELLIELEYK